MKKIKLKQTHKYDFIQGYNFVKAKYKNNYGYVYSDHNIRVVYKDENNIQYSLFETIKTLIGLEWFNDALVESLETDYYLLQSGEKNISNMFYNLLTYYNSQDLNNDYINVSEKVYIALANVIISRFKDNWNKVYETYIKSSYNPLETYIINETIKENYKLTKNNTNNEESTQQDNTTQELEKNKTTNNNETTTFNNTNSKESIIEEKTSAYNSETYQPKNENIGSETITDKGDNNITTKETINDLNNSTITSNSTKNKTNTNEENISRNANDNFITREKNGNLYKSSQTLIEQELKLRKYDFMLMIMQDIDKVLVSKIY